tara:strand:+ start:1401 stop:1598 length:198 start_codon:yes stop_codon:yes gene_type:complete
MDIKNLQSSLETIEAVCVDRNLKPTVEQIIGALFTMHGMTEDVTAGVMYISHDIDALAAKLAEVK